MSKTPAKKTRTVARRPAPSVPDHAPPQLTAAAASQVGSLSEQTARTPPVPTIYCTIATAQELPQALLLRDSLQAAQGPVDFRLLLVEQPAVVARLRAELPEVAILAPSELGCAQWRSMAFYYDPREYAAALKPALLRTLLRAGNVIYLDPDIEVLAPLAALEQQLGAADVVVLPARAELPPAGDGAATGLALRPGGEFNLSVIGLGQGAATEKLLGWLQEQLIEGGHESPEHGLYPEALWAAAFIAAPRLQIVRSRQYDLQPGGPGTSELTLGAAQAPQTPEGPLCLLHHGGRAGRQADSSPDAPLHHLLAERARKLDASPYQRFAASPYSFDRYESGERIPVQHRRALWQLPRVNRQMLDDPFAERPYIMQLAAQLAPGPCPRCAELEARLNRLPYSLVGYVGKLTGAVADAIIDRTVPGGRERVASTVREAASRGASARYYAGQVLDKVVPGSRDRLYGVIKAATTSPRPAIRRTAAVMLGAAGVLP